ncbi:3-deoxy-manno-octulosonate cytidylyltransferase [Paenibacillus macerans]|uniref:3-deoxy-manno-octulosonate cytidylyltransferase n=1 Tax=Paenibacillus macerans TaxID=44252 RepID=UPI001B1D8413|nr:3-deoxy-manno-octulosonate cytidylyltransferase [Paenibacillus macerans]MBS5911256.1 3-deoxy-manno-octulosonate cytidylyltransferase [Paenibacillus macerans]MEC0139345.1 3-deoxy-manno-octulosonate cytidylyltransferase [Paenibacillus macerans]GIP08604.1 3-deoxy-manno-octulosonate cytidylyltransferase [Paenibacillus macerans]
MKKIAIIPARYNSSRFVGKPLADICGKPMIWWVYNQVRQVKELDEVIVATDNDEILDVCIDYGIEAVMTSNSHDTSTERAYEVAQQKRADLYVVVNGDEPLIAPETIQKIIPDLQEIINDRYFVSNLITEITEASEVVDFTNIKVVSDINNYAMFMSRSPIPYPKASLKFRYKKHLGVLAYNFEALKFFSDTEKGPIEKIEDINELRFLENGIKIKIVEVDAESLSVDTPKDLEKVVDVLQRRMV